MERMVDFGALGPGWVTFMEPALETLRFYMEDRVKRLQETQVEDGFKEAGTHKTCTSVSQTMSQHRGMEMGTKSHL